MSATLQVVPQRAIKELEEELCLSHETLARAIGVEKRSIARWREGGDYPRPKARGALADLYEFRNRLLNSFSPRDAKNWLRKENEYLGGLTPGEVLAAGRLDRVNETLDALEYGVYM